MLFPYKKGEKWLSANENGGAGLGLFRGSSEDYPPLNIWEDAQKIVITAQVPGITAERIELSVCGRVLELVVTAGIDLRGTEPQHFYQREIVRKEARRVLELPSGVDVQRIEARLAKGILALQLPKAGTQRVRRIEVV